MMSDRLGIVLKLWGCGAPCECSQYRIYKPNPRELHGREQMWSGKWVCGYDIVDEKKKKAEVQGFLFMSNVKIDTIDDVHGGAWLKEIYPDIIDYWGD